MLRGFITQPEFRTIHRQPCYYTSTGIFQAEQLNCTEGGFVEVYSGGAISD